MVVRFLLHHYIPFMGFCMREHHERENNMAIKRDVGITHDNGCDTFELFCFVFVSAHCDAVVLTSKF